MADIIYGSLDEAVEDLTANLLPILRIAKSVADSGRGPQCTGRVYSDLQRLLALLEDRDRLRRCFEEHYSHDGRIEVRFTPAAEALWRHHDRSR